MDNSTLFLIYAALYRLTVLAVGALSIWLGFRLFSTAGSKGKTADGSGSASAEAGGVKLTFTNLLPGSYFALFGTVIIGIMLWKGEPQLNQKNVTETTGQNERQAPVVVLRSSTEQNLRNDGCLGADCEKDSLDIRQEWDKLKPETSLSEAALPLSRIATAWQKEKRVGEALPLAQLAALYGKAENKADHLTLLAALLRANGEEEAAAETEQAAEAARKNPGKDGD